MWGYADQMGFQLSLSPRVMWLVDKEGGRCCHLWQFPRWPLRVPTLQVMVYDHLSWSLLRTVIERLWDIKVCLCVGTCGLTVGVTAGQSSTVGAQRVLPGLTGEQLLRQLDFSPSPELPSWTAPRFRAIAPWRWLKSAVFRCLGRIDVVWGCAEQGRGSSMHFMVKGKRISSVSEERLPVWPNQWWGFAKLNWTIFTFKSKTPCHFKIVKIKLFLEHYECDDHMMMSTIISWKASSKTSCDFRTSDFIIANFV